MTVIYSANEIFFEISQAEFCRAEYFFFINYVLAIKPIPKVGANFENVVLILHLSHFSDRHIVGSLTRFFEQSCLQFKRGEEGSSPRVSPIVPSRYV